MINFSFKRSKIINYYSTCTCILLIIIFIIILCVGHSFAGGGLLALTHDYRLMKRERGWFSLPEVHLKMEFTKPLMELVKYIHTHCIQDTCSKD